MRAARLGGVEQHPQVSGPRERALRATALASDDVFARRQAGEIQTFAGRCEPRQCDGARHVPQEAAPISVASGVPQACLIMRASREVSGLGLRRTSGHRVGAWASGRRAAATYASLFYPCVM